MNDAAPNLEVKTAAPPSRTALYAAVGQSWSKALAGPALSAMVVIIIAVLAAWLPWGVRWTAATEQVRVHYIGGIGVVLALVIALVYLKLEAGIGVASLGLKVGGLVSADLHTEHPDSRTAG